MAEFDINEKMDSIRRDIREFRKTQEARLFSAEDSTIESNESLYSKMASKNDISFVLGSDVLITPHITNTTEWPTSLCADFNECGVDIGNMESNGSVWRILKREKLGIDGLVVMLQTSEIGEKNLYMDASLGLSSDINSAALWLVRILAPEEYSDKTKPVFAFGALVQFELLSETPKMESIQGAMKERNRASYEPRLLVAARSKNDSGEKGVAILTDNDRNASANEYLWTLTWQVAREDTKVEGFDFLNDDA